MTTRTELIDGLLAGRDPASVMRGDGWLGELRRTLLNRVVAADFKQQMVDERAAGAGTRRLAATLSLLRRAHDHHPDLRAMVATPRTTAPVRSNREHPVVTRHGLRSPDAATLPSRRKSRGTPFVETKTDGLDISRDRSPVTVTAGEQPHPPSSGGTRRRAAFPTTTARQNMKSPWTITAAPRVRAWAFFVRVTASENLHHVGRPLAEPVVSKADAGDARPERTLPVVSIGNASVKMNVPDEGAWRVGARRCWR